jgi:hypothetical protein
VPSILDAQYGQKKPIECETKPQQGATHAQGIHPASIGQGQCPFISLAKPHGSLIFWAMLVGKPSAIPYIASFKAYSSAIRCI